MPEGQRRNTNRMKLSNGFLLLRLNPGKGDPKMTGKAPRSTEDGARW